MKKILVSYNTGRVKKHIKGTVPEVAEFLKYETSLKGMTPPHAKEAYKKEIEAMLYADIDNPHTSEMAIDLVGSPFQYGTNAGGRPTGRLYFTIIDVLEEE